MTVVMSSLLVFLLFLSSHACYARRLDDHATNNEHEKKLHISSKDNEKGSLTKVSSVPVPPKFKPSMSKEPIKVHAANGEDAYEVIDHTTTNQKDSKGTSRKLLKGQRGKNNSGDIAVQKGTHGSISWRVPHKKRGEHQPSFNLDYSPPKTHPGHHN